MKADFERAIIATFLYADSSPIEAHINATEIREEWFSDFDHKLIVHAINHLISTGFYDEVTVKDYLERDRRLNVSALELCMSANTAGTIETLNRWIDNIRGSMKSLHQDV